MTQIEGAPISLSEAVSDPYVLPSAIEASGVAVTRIVESQQNVEELGHADAFIHGDAEEEKVHAYVTQITQAFAQQTEAPHHYNALEPGNKCTGHACALHELLVELKSSLEAIGVTISGGCETIADKFSNAQFLGIKGAPQQPLGGDETVVSHNDSMLAASATSIQDYHLNIDGEMRDRAKRRLVLLVLGAVLSAMAVAVAGFCVCMRLRNPRARAEFATWREERRTARRFRRAARRHAWREWFRQRFPARCTDYDEKRRMILEQEDVLEHATGAEMMRLAVAAEEGRVPSRQPSSVGRPPSYRSRASSEGAPPSYHRFAAGGHAMVQRTGGSMLCGSSIAGTDVPELTPDSSVRDLSPRQSFETLRTDFSAS